MRLGSLGNRLRVGDFCAVSFLRIALRIHICTGGKEAGLSREPDLLCSHIKSLSWSHSEHENWNGLQSCELWRWPNLYPYSNLLLGLVFSQKRPWPLERPRAHLGEGNGTPLQYSCLENPMGRGAWWAAVHGVVKSRIRLSDLTFTFHFHALEKELATHSSVLAWRIPGMGEPGWLPSMGSHRVGQDWSDLAAEHIWRWAQLRTLGCQPSGQLGTVPPSWCGKWMQKNQ